jgi:hypothetical protein
MSGDVRPIENPIDRSFPSGPPPVNGWSAVWLFPHDRMACFCMKQSQFGIWRSVRRCCLYNPSPDHSASSSAASIARNGFDHPNMWCWELLLTLRGNGSSGLAYAFLIFVYID